MRGNLVGDLLESEPVDPGADEGSKFWVRVDLALDAGAMLATVISGESLARGQVLNAMFNGLLKGCFKAVDGAFLGGVRCLQFGQCGGDERGHSGHLPPLD